MADEQDQTKNQSPAFNVEKAAKSFAYISTFLISVGILKLHLFYKHFYINILDYLELSEVVAYIFSDVLDFVGSIIVVILLEVFFGNTIENRFNKESEAAIESIKSYEARASSIANDFEKISGRVKEFGDLTAEQRASLKEDLEVLNTEVVSLQQEVKSRKNKAGKTSKRLKIVIGIIYIPLIVSIYLVYHYSIASFEEFVGLLIRALGIPIAFIITLWSIGKYRRKGFTIDHTYVIILLAAIFFIIMALTNTLKDIGVAKNYYPHLGSKITLENDTIKTDSTIQYLGRTQKYMFLFNRKDTTAIIIPLEQVKREDLKKNPERKDIQIKIRINKPNLPWISS